MVGELHDDAPDKIFRLVTLRKCGHRELVHVNLFALKESAESHCAWVVKNGGSLVSLTLYRKVEDHENETDFSLVVAGEAVQSPEPILFSEPYPNARN